MPKQLPGPAQAIIINAILFTVLLALTNPVYDTTEDVTILYLLSGGFGTPPTELVHYNHILHPFLGIILKSLFLLTGQINWYTVCLLLAHYTACTIMLALVLQRQPKPTVILSYVLLFLVFECKLLSTVNFSNTSIVLGCAGCALLYAATQEQKLNRRKIAWGMIVLLAASLFRIHVLIPVAGIALPFFYVQIKPRHSIAITAAMMAAALLIILCNQVQQAYYKTHIAGWQQEEDYRQHVFRFYNSHVLHKPEPGEKWYTEYNLIQNGLPIDTSFLNRGKLNSMYADLKTDQPKVAAPAGKNWFWVNNRIFFLCIIFLLAALHYKRKSLIAFVLSMALMAAGLFYLHKTAKTPEYVLISGLFLAGMFMVLSADLTRAANKYLAYTKTAGLCLLLFWGVVRTYKMNQQTQAGIDAFRNAYAEIAQRKDTLFIISADAFPLQKFSIFDCPQHYKLTNFLNSEHFICNLYQPVLKNYHINSIRQVPYKPNALFWGLRVQALENYFREVTNGTVWTSPPLQEFRQGSVFSISALNTGQ